MGSIVGVLVHARSFDIQGNGQVDWYRWLLVAIDDSLHERAVVYEDRREGAQMVVVTDVEPFIHCRKQHTAHIAIPRRNSTGAGGSSRNIVSHTILPSVQY